jgi:hypothetical protein
MTNKILKIYIIFTCEEFIKNEKISLKLAKIVIKLKYSNKKYLDGFQSNVCEKIRLFIKYYFTILHVA